MPDQHDRQLLEYVKRELARGVSPAAIRGALAAQGWLAHDIDEAFTAAGTPIPSTISVMPRPSVEFLEVGELFSRAFQLFRSRFLTMFGVALVGVVPALAVLFVGATLLATRSTIIPIPHTITAPMDCAAADCVSQTATAFPWIPVGTLLALAVIIMAWEGTAFVIAARDDIAGNSVFGSYRLALPKILPLLWVDALTALAVIGGMMLLIVPGVMISIWLAAVRFVVIVEDTRGTRALAKSKAYVAGRWWAVFGRMLAVGLATLVALSLFDLVAQMAFGKGVIAGIFAVVGYFAVTVYTVVYVFALYQTLAASRPEVTTRNDHSRTELVAFIIVALAAVALIAFALSRFLHG